MKIIRICLGMLFGMVLASCGGSSGSGTSPTTFGISGTVKGAAGVTVSLSGTSTAPTTTDGSGNYSFAGLANGNYTVTASLASYAFNPISRAVSVSGANVTGINFTATAAATTYSISGTVSGTVAQNVTITLSGANAGSVLTNVSGNYTIPGLANGSYTVTPSFAGHTFSPPSSDITISGANSPANNFVSSTSGVYSFSYFKRGGTATAQTATLTSGTLSIDGKSITGVSYSGGACVSRGIGTELTSCSSPADAPHTMLLCGPDPITAAPDTLLYVLFDTPDANRVVATSTSFLNALQSETNYLGTRVYTNCSGSFNTSWIRNYSQTNYYLWPDVFTTYTSAYVANLLSGAAIYSTPAAGNNYHEYVAVRVSATVFEVWH